MVQRENGFSLLELMIAVTVLAIILGIGVPSYNAIIDSSRLQSVTHDLRTAIQLARSEALSERNTVAACRANAAGNACGFDADWSSGWLIARLDGANLETAADVEVLRVWEGTTLTVSGIANGIVFDRRGRPDSAGTLDIRGSECRRLSVNATGRVATQEIVCP